PGRHPASAPGHPRVDHRADAGRRRPGRDRQPSRRGHHRHPELAGMTTAAPTTTMSGRYQRAFTIAVVVLVAGWHLAGAGGQLLDYRPAYASFAFQGVMWLVLAVAIGVG